MPTKFASVLMMFLLLAGAAAEDGKTSSYNGVIRPDCGPVGGPAISIAISVPSFQLQRGVKPPPIEIRLLQETSLREGQVIKLGPSDASKCVNQFVCEFATSGDLRIDRTSSSEVTGRYELHFKNEEAISGHFNLRSADPSNFACY